MSDDPIRQRYDQVPYESDAFAFAQPGRMAALARLVGLNPPDPRKARVLELGCAAGGNLISMAQQLPEAHFVGIDLSENQIAVGQEMVRELKLNNVELKAVNLLDIDRGFGQFDYLVAHGLYSWVPAEVREKLLAIYAQNMTPQGVAFVSYYLWPGNVAANVMRELLTLHTRGASDYAGQMKSTREMLSLMGACLSQHQTPYSSILKSEVEVLTGMKDWYLLHDALAPVNESFYFHQFMERASAHGLAYAGESMPYLTAMEQFPPSVRQMLRQHAHDPVELEQWIDVLAQRAMRKSILCHAGVAVDHRKLRPEAARGMYVASPAKVEGEPAGSVIHFRRPDGGSVGTADPLVKSVISRLIRAWPESLAVDSVLEEFKSTPADKLLLTLMQMLSFGLVEFDAYPPTCRRMVSEKPVASAFARLQARRGEKISSLRHDQAGFGPLHRQVLVNLDGTRTREDLIAQCPEAAGSLNSILNDLAGFGILQA